MTLQGIIADIHAMDRELQKYEDKYGLRSQYFYELYTSGKLRDEDPDESREYGDWIEEIERELLATGSK